MILLDTNVLSALMQATPDPVVVEWLDNEPAESMWTTSITVFEIHTGINLLERGRRRSQLERSFTQLLKDDLNGRVQVFDQAAALTAGTIAAEQQRNGRPVEIRDVQIAGIAASRRAVLATRNTRHFETTGIDLINPWA
ncbi:MAG: type II toxin-antitoxin system VapC family toxin [Mycobacterium sp.]